MVCGAGVGVSHHLRGWLGAEDANAGSRQYAEYSVTGTEIGGLPWQLSVGGVKPIIFRLGNDGARSLGHVRAGHAGKVELVHGWATATAPAEATLTGPALIWTVFTLTGFIGSDEPGMAAIDWFWITPLVSGAGSGLAGDGGTAAAAAARSEGR